MNKTPNLRQNAPAPVAPKPIVLPPVKDVPKPTIGPGLPGRINSPLGGFAPSGALIPTNKGQW